MNTIQTLSTALDILIRKIVKISPLVPNPGLVTGKTGIAILLYHYARYKNDTDMLEYADHLIDLIIQEISFISGTGLDDGLCGIARGFDYLIKREFIQAEEDFLKEIDEVLFRDKNRALRVFDLSAESEKCIYLLNRFYSGSHSKRTLWGNHLEKCFQNLLDIWKSKYTMYELPVFPCKTLIRFFYVSRLLREYGRFNPEIDTLYKSLTEIVKISYGNEKSFSDRDMLSSLLSGIPELEQCCPVDDTPRSPSLMDVINYKSNRLVLGQSIAIPKEIEKTILSVTANQQQFNDLLNQLNPLNAGLQFFGGLAWSILSSCEMT